MVNQYFAYTLAGLGVLLLLWGYSDRSRRLALWFGGIAAVFGATAAYYDSFWAAVCLALLAVAGLIGATSLVDGSWRVRAGIVFGIFAVSLVALWPTAARMSGGMLPLPEYIQKNVDFELVAGLDLSGGLRLVYTVDVGEAIRDRRDRRYEDMRVELAKLFDVHEGDEPMDDATLAKLREKVELTPSRAQANLITLKLREGVDPKMIDARFLNQFSGDLSFSRSEDLRTYTFRMKEEAESELRATAVGQAKEIILRRVDQLGLKEAAVSTRDEDIIVEVPGESEERFDEIREIISQTARLEFKLLDDDTDFFATIAKDSTQQLPEGVDFLRENAPVGLDEEGDTKTRTNYYAMIQKRDGETSVEALARFKEWTSTLSLPPDRELGYQLEYRTDDSGVETEIGWRTYLLRSRAEITGDLIRDAQAVPDQGRSAMGGWYVALEFTDQGGSIFDRITAASIKRRFAIILDDRVESAPVIQTRISGGRASITMGASDPQSQLEDSRKLELVLRSGALPAPITPSNEQRIGASLGEASIDMGLRGAIVGGLSVFAFMLLYYRRAGTIAIIAVTTNLMLQLAILATLGAAMTLPGIAGLALVVGMSVDANVLINERIREELRDGRSPRAAVELGYSKALSAIVDGQLTTLISAVVLAQFGTGPIKGFAVALMVGVTTSIFTGIVVTRLLFDLWVRGMGRDSKLDMG